MLSPSPLSLLTDWTLEPSIVAGLLLLCGLYLYAIGPLARRRGEAAASTAQLVAFGCAVFVLAFALLSALDELGDRYLFSAHMVQHLLLATLFPPLILLATPGWVVRPLFQRKSMGAVAGALTAPVAALLLFNADIYLWHFPALYELTLQNGGVHIVEHLSFMAFGIINWWPVLSPLPEQRLSYPLQVLYLFANMMIMMVLGILFTFSPMVFYPTYAAAPRLWGIGALSDQEIGGLIMWYAGNVPYGLMLSIAFYRWFEGSEDGDEAAGVLEQSPTMKSPL